MGRVLEAGRTGGEYLLTHSSWEGTKLGGGGGGVKLYLRRCGRDEVLIWRSQILSSSPRGKFRAKNRR